MSTRKELHASAREELIAGFDLRMAQDTPQGLHGEHTPGQRMRALGETLVAMIAKRDAQIEAMLGRLQPDDDEGPG